MSDVIRFEVRGRPVPQGSARGFAVGKRVIITSANKNLSAWRRLMSDVAQRHAPEEGPWTGPVSVRLTFRLPQPANVRDWVGRGKKKTPKRNWPATRPDLDKVCRSALDSMSNIIFKDDSQVVELHATKEYGIPGVVIVVVRVVDPNLTTPLVARGSQ